MTAVAPPREASTLEVYRDDGPLARALGGVLGPVVRIPPIALIAAGVLPGVLLLSIKGDRASNSLVAAVIACFFVCAAVSAGRPHTDRLRWAVPPALRLVEYAALLWLGALADATPAAFALLCALTFRHYDLVYRLRHQGVAPPPWVGDLAAGWDGRLIVGFALMALGALPAGFYIAAALLGAVFVGDSVAGWRQFGRALQPAVYEDEEEQDA
jgi:hypothetical protein